MQVDHVSIAVPVTKVEAEVSFFTKSLAHMGFKECMRPLPALVGMGVQAPFLWVSGLEDRQEIVESEKHIVKMHLALSAQNRQQVDEFHKTALEAGGVCNGKPGVRAHYHPNYYSAFVLDPCGNNIEVVVHQPPIEGAGGK